MKRFIVVIAAAVAYFSFTACGDVTQEETDSTLVGIEDFAMADTLEGVWGVKGFEEFEIVIGEGQIMVKQGSVDLWVGTFNSDMPAVGDFTVVSERDPEAHLPYIEEETLSLEFPFSNGVLTYTDPVLEASLDFTKVS